MLPTLKITEDKISIEGKWFYYTRPLKVIESYRDPFLLSVVWIDGKGTVFKYKMDTDLTRPNLPLSILF